MKFGDTTVEMKIPRVVESNLYRNKENLIKLRIKMVSEEYQKKGTLVSRKALERKR